MSDSINKLVDTLIKAIDQRQTKKTKGYSTQAEVLRVQNGTAWVHIPGGADETPVQETIACKKGDTVQVRVEGGKATLTGNQSAPPTDDTKAEKAQETAEDAAKVAADAKEEAEGTSQYFWYMNGTSSEAGAHVTEVPASDFRKKPSGGNILMRSNSIKIRNALITLAEFTNNGVVLYKSLSDKLAEFLSSGLTVYNGEGTEVAHLGYGAGYDINGNLVDDPFYTLGVRYSGSAVGNYSCAIGDQVIASGADSQAMGVDCSASATYAHAEGEASNASGAASHAENSSTASGSRAHSEGGGTASGDYSHAEGLQTTASGNYTHAGGEGTIAGYAHQTAIGKYNNNKSTDLFEVGNGSSNNARANAFEVDKGGNATFAGDLVTPEKASFGSLDNSIFAVTTEPVFASTSINGGAQKYNTVALSKPNYYPLGVVGWNSPDTSAFVPARLRLSAQAAGSGTLSYSVRNVASTAQTGEFKADILWLKVA